MRWPVLLVVVLLALLPAAAWAAPEDSWAEHRAAQRSATLDGERIAWLDRGSGPVVVLLHGGMGSSWEYRRMAAVLVQRGYRVVAPDLVGFGTSARPEDPAALSLERQALRVQALLDHLHIERASVVCHDLGGLVTWELLARAPERVERLVVLDSLVFAEGWVPEADRTRQALVAASARRVIRSEERAKRLAGRALAEGLGDKALARDPAVVEGWFRPMAAGADLTIGITASIVASIGPTLPRYQATLGAVSVPTMIAWGTEDRVLLAREQVPRIAALLDVPFERVHLLEGAGHQLPEERGEELAGLVDAFLRQSL